MQWRCPEQQRKYARSDRPGQGAVLKKDPEEAGREHHPVNL